MNRVLYPDTGAWPRTATGIDKAVEPGELLTTAPAGVVLDDKDAAFYQVFEDGRVERKTDAEFDSIIAARALPLVLERLESDMHNYVFQYYDRDTQNTLQALYADPATPADVKADCKAAWDWIMTVLTYYAGKKAEMAAATDPAAVAYNFEGTLDATLPKDGGVVISFTTVWTKLQAVKK